MLVLKATGRKLVSEQRLDFGDVARRGGLAGAL
jgi:hypothetical protein